MNGKRVENLRTCKKTNKAKVTRSCDSLYCVVVCSYSGCRFVFLVLTPCCFRKFAQNGIGFASPPHFLRACWACCWERPRLRLAPALLESLLSMLLETASASPRPCMYSRAWSEFWCISLCLLSSFLQYFPLDVLRCGVWMWCHFGRHFGVVLVVIWGSFWGHFGVMLARPNPNPLKEAKFQFSPNDFDNFDANLGPKLGSKLAQNRHLTSLKFRVRFWRDFGASWARFWEPFGSKIEIKTKLKIRSVNNAKFDSRVDGSSIFDVPGRSKIDQKSIRKGLQDKTSF